MSNEYPGYRPGQSHRPAPYKRQSSKALTQQNYLQHPDFQTALKLWRQSLYWETHEVLESLWKDPVQAQEKLCLQAFIQICAAALKVNEDEARGRLLHSAREKLKSLNVSQLFGVSIEKWCECLAIPDQQTRCYQIQHFELASETPKLD